MKLAAIVLAAGAGSRLGGGKLTRQYGGRPLVAHALAAADAAPVGEVVVVTGHDAAAVEAAVAASGAARPVRIVRAEDWADGMAASLRAGVAALRAETDGAFVLLGDMPAIPAAVFAPLVERFAQGAAAVAPVFEGRRGHPVLFGRALFAAIGRLSGDEGARSLLRGAALVPTEHPGVLHDIDTPADLAATPRPRP